MVQAPLPALSPASSLLLAASAAAACVVVVVVIILASCLCSMLGTSSELC